MIKRYTHHTHFLRIDNVFELEFHLLAMLSIVRFGVGFFVFIFRVINCGSIRVDITPILQTSFLWLSKSTCCLPVPMLTELYD